ncbi:MAG: UTP--glucose-1-phosphate uridylyltransferase, partial [Clostridia bacterium]|nr:UTP--glucose-1-phosphate uridylyltransferase [Clostridia bacterium]
GLAGAILCAKPYLNGEPFALLLGDELLYVNQGEENCIQKLVNVYEKTGKSVIATIEVFGDDVSKYGNIGIREESDGIITVDKIVEKPSINEALSNNAIIGRYVLSGEVVSMLEKLTPRNNEIYLTDALDELSNRGDLLACVCYDDRYDVGDKFGFIKANIDFSLKSKEIGEDVKNYILELSDRLK